MASTFNATLNEDVDKLKSVWLNEVNAPELLDFNEFVVSEMAIQIKNQQQYLDSIRDDQKSMTEERAFTYTLYQMEIDRLKYMLSSYLRTRLWKIEKFAYALLRDPELSRRLSPQEIQFANDFVILRENHFRDCAVAKFPEEHLALDADGMVHEPELNTFVFCESQASLGQVQCDDRGAEHVTIRENDRHVVRYRSVQEFVQNEQMTLI